MLICIGLFLTLNTAWAQNTVDKEKAVYVRLGLQNLYGKTVAIGFEKLFSENPYNAFSLDLNCNDIYSGAGSTSTNIYTTVNYKRYLPVASRFYPYGGLGLLAGFYKNQNDSTSEIQEGYLLLGARTFIGAEYRFSEMTPFLECGYSFSGDHWINFNIGVKLRF